MNAMITIPDETIEDLRAGLHGMLGAAAERLGEVATRAACECHPEWYEEPLEELQQAITVLDIIGWSSEDQLAQVELDALEHRWVLLEALDMVLRVAEDNLMEMTALVRAEGAKRDSLARRMQSMSDLADTINAQTPARADRLTGENRQAEEQQQARRPVRRPSSRTLRR